MNPHIKAKWVEALRSGKYQQERGSLRSANGFCCLGVLCDLGERKAWVDYGGGLWTYYSPSLDYFSAFPSNGMLKSMGLHERTASMLAGMNDRGSTFEQIADWIEANL